MRVKTKLRIGEFSQLMQVTVKTLHHYEQMQRLSIIQVPVEKLWCTVWHSGAAASEVQVAPDSFRNSGIWHEYFPSFGRGLFRRLANVCLVIWWGFVHLAGCVFPWMFRHRRAYRLRSSHTTLVPFTPKASLRFALGYALLRFQRVLLAMFAE